MDLPGQPPALQLLGLDGAGGEALEHLLPLGQPLVEAGVLDGPGHEVGHLGEQGQVVGRRSRGRRVEWTLSTPTTRPRTSIGTDTIDA